MPIAVSNSAPHSCLPVFRVLYAARPHPLRLPASARYTRQTTDRTSQQHRPVTSPVPSPPTPAPYPRPMGVRRYLATLRMRVCMWCLSCCVNLDGDCVSHSLYLQAHTQPNRRMQVIRHSRRADATQRALLESVDGQEACCADEWEKSFHGAQKNAGTRARGQPPSSSIVPSVHRAVWQVVKEHEQSRTRCGCSCHASNSKRPGPWSEAWSSWPVKAVKAARSNLAAGGSPKMRPVPPLPGHCRSACSQLRPPSIHFRGIGQRPRVCSASCESAPWQGRPGGCVARQACPLDIRRLPPQLRAGSDVRRSRQCGS